MEPIGNDRAYSFCSHLVRRSDNAFHVLQEAIGKTQQIHISDELVRLEADR